ncbi:MAG TPA: AAA family ATPase [Rhodopila sp.]
MTIPPEQEDVVRFLAGLAGAPPKETHISAVFVGTDTVWKLKKAVRLPFLNFTTCDAREHFLRRELELNKPAASGIYRDVIGIERDTGQALRFGDDHAIDFVLRMAPVPSQDFLDVIASDNRLTAELLDDLGDAVSACHGKLPPLLGRDFAATMRDITQGNLRSALAAGLPEPDVTAWQAQINEAIDGLVPWMAERSSAGYVRRCHGDLHLGNLCLWEGKPVPFDALEFDEALATIDVGYDLAFLLMDLDQRVGRAAANRVMNRYIARTGDARIMAGLPVFLSQRAIIRAHVLAAMGQDGAAYLTAARRYLAPAEPAVIAIGGLQGTGKSTLARALAPELGRPPGALIVRSDEIRKRLFGLHPQQRLQQESYGPDANIATNSALIEQTRVAAEAGHTAIVDATFLDIETRRDLKAAVGSTGVRFLGIWLQAPLALLEQRVAARTGDASDATVAVLRRSAGNDPGPVDWLAVDASDATRALASVRQALLNALT